MLRPTKSSTPIRCWACRPPATRTRSAARGSRCARPARPREPCWSRRRPSAGMSIRRPAARKAAKCFIAPTGRRLNYGELAADAARMPVPENVALKEPKDFKLIGTPAKRLDTPAKVNGTAVYGIDARPPGVKIATLAQSPVFGGRVKSVDDTAAKAVKGVRQIVRLDDAVAVVADHMGAAKKGLAALDDRMGRRPARQAQHRRHRARARTGDAQAGRGGAEHRRRRQGHGGRRHQGRGDLPGSVPRARDDGADELHGSCPPGRLRNLGRQPGAGARPGGGREGRRPAAGEGRGPQSSDRRRIWPAAGGRRRRPRGRDRQAGRRPGEGRVDARGRHPARHVSALLVRPAVRRPRREGHAGRLEQSLRRLLGHREMAAAGVQQRSRSRHDRRRDRSGLRPAEPPRRICAGGAAGHSDRVLAQRRAVAQRLRDRKLHGRAGGSGEAGSGRLSARAPRQDAARQGGA